MKLSFVVPGPPVPKARARVYQLEDGSTMTRTPTRTKHYQKHIGSCAWAERLRYSKHSNWPQEHPNGYRVDILIYGDPKGDGDNYLKVVMDGMQKVLYKNDKMVRAGSFDIVSDSDPRPRIEVTVTLR